MTRAVAHSCQSVIQFSLCSLHTSYLRQLEQPESIAILTPVIVLSKQRSTVSPSMTIANLPEYLSSRLYTYYTELIDLLRGGQI